jgi:phosphoenolpyruvate-protein kinase (PTS system EI component)
LLIGLGLREFSMAATAIPVAKQVVRGLRAEDARRVAGRSLRATTPAEVEKTLVDYLAPEQKR